MREVILDTETTGLSIEDGHRIIEIAACEMKDYVLTGENFHKYINPERDIDIGASNIHGIKIEDLKNEPKFNEVCNDLIDFIKDSRLIIHNADFDISFLNNEFKICGSNFRISDNFLDTLKLARKVLPGSLVNLDSLCRRYDISLNKRDYHGALVDTHLLADVYIELIGGKQTTLKFNSKRQINDNDSFKAKEDYKHKELIKERKFRPSDNELEKHKDFIKNIKNPIWEKYF